MTIQTKMKIRRSGDKAQILVLVNHPMETGQHLNKQTNSPITAQYIETMTFKLNGTPIAEASLGPGIAANPMTGIVLNHAKPGDVVTVVWTDNKDKSGFAEETIT
jgi:sulfur-oxidizing protein SoxZ